MTEIRMQYRVITFSAANEDDDSEIWKLEDETVDTGEIVLKDGGIVGLPIEGLPADLTVSKDGKDYNFAFWTAEVGNIGLPKFPSFNRHLTIEKEDAKDQTQNGVATAWYVEVNKSTGVPGPAGPPALRVRTFDTDLNNFRKETSIDKVAPANAWAGPNKHSVSTNDAAVTASLEGHLKFPVAQKDQPPGTPPKLFKKWIFIGGRKPEFHAKSPIPCDKGNSALAISFYGIDPKSDTPGIRDPGLVSSDIYVLLWIKMFGPEVAGPHNPDAPHTPKFRAFVSIVESVLKAMPEQQRNVAIRKITGMAREQ